MLMGLTALATALTQIEQAAEHAHADNPGALLKQLAQDLAATRQALVALTPAGGLLSACAVSVGH